MNRMLGQKLSIVTAKPQTTRQRICGIKTTDSGQIVYVDTPGIHKATTTALNRYMNRIARASVVGVDLVLMIVEGGRWTAEDDTVAESLGSAGIPVFLVINKIDLLKNKSQLLDYVDTRVPNERFERVLLVSAKTGDGIDDLERFVSDSLPYSHPFFSEDQITDRSERFLASEFIREQLTQRLHQELPYVLTVEIERFERTAGILKIGAVIWVERPGQKHIVIGKGGNVLKQAGSGARAALEAFFGEKVFLETWVKVGKGWSNDDRLLKKLGYDEFD